MGPYGIQKREQRDQSVEKVPGAEMQAWTAQGVGRKTQEILQEASSGGHVRGESQDQLVHTAFTMLIPGRGDPERPAENK